MDVNDGYLACDECEISQKCERQYIREILEEIYTDMKEKFIIQTVYDPLYMEEIQKIDKQIETSEITYRSATKMIEDLWNKYKENKSLENHMKSLTLK